jgi:hypothetical protein
VLTGGFEVWRTLLHPSQRALAEKPVPRPAKMPCGAGNGKTVVAVERALPTAPAHRGGEPSGRVLVATFTLSLQGNLERTLRGSCAPEEFKRLRIPTVEALTSQTLAAEGVKLLLVSEAQLRSVAEAAAAAAALDAHGRDGRSLLAEWRQVILARHHRSLASETRGRSRRLKIDYRTGRQRRSSAGPWGC